MAYYKEESNMEDYCYEQQEYASEYDEEVISDYDADMGNHETSDDESDCDWTVSAEKRSEQKSSAPKPIQLAPITCTCKDCIQDGQEKPCDQKFWTMEEMEAFYQEETRLNNKRIEDETNKEMEEMYTAYQKQVDEEEYWKSVVATLPTEPKAMRERKAREAREAKEKAEIEQRNSRTNENKFKARRSGGRRRIVKQIDGEVMKARRTARRKKAKETKRVEEAKRKESFEKEGITESRKVVALVQQQDIEDDDDDSDEKTEEQILLEEKEKEEEKMIEEEEKIKFTAALVAKIEREEEKEKKRKQMKEECVEKEKEEEKDLEELMFLIEPSRRIATTRKTNSVLERCTPKNDLIIPPMKEEKGWNVVKKQEREKSTRVKKIKNESATKPYECKWFSSGKECPYGDNCKFLHNKLPTPVPLPAPTVQHSVVATPLLIEPKKWGKLPQNVTSTPVLVEPKRKNSQPKQTTGTSLPSNSSNGTMKKTKMIPLDLTIGEKTRSEALEILSNKKQLGDNLAKTRLCRSVGTNNPCPHGSRCRFAHSSEELEIRSCVFGSRCKFVYVDYNGEYKSTLSKRCLCKHPNESEDNFYTRTGIPKPQKNHMNIKMPPLTITPKVVPVPKSAPWAPVKKVNPVKENIVNDEVYRELILPIKQVQEPQPNEQVQQPQPIKQVQQPNKQVQQPQLQPIKQVQQPNKQVQQPNKQVQQPQSVEQETVLRVPRELAIQAMQLAMQSGKTNIRVEII